MNGNQELLNFIYQNAEMGTTTLEQLLGIVKDEKFKLQLQSQQNEYHEIIVEVKQMINQRGEDEKGISTFDKMKAYMMINIQTMSDKSNSHIADMLIIGSNMGIVQATKKIHKYAGADKEILDLMEKLLAFEERNCEALKSFL